jgi:hypothetical protein
MSNRWRMTMDENRGWGGAITGWGFDAAASDLAYALRHRSGGVSQRELGLNDWEMDELRAAYRRLTGERLPER